MHRNYRLAHEKVEHVIVNADSCLVFASSVPVPLVCFNYIVSSFLWEHFLIIFVQRIICQRMVLKSELSSDANILLNVMNGVTKNISYRLNCKIAGILSL